MMTDKERVNAAFNGQPVDRMPVYPSYLTLYQQDHFHELTGYPRHHFQKWLYSPQEEFIATLRSLTDTTPFDILQAPYLPTDSAWRNTKYIEKDGCAYLLDSATGQTRNVTMRTESDHAEDYQVNEKVLVRDLQDLRSKCPIVRANDLLKDGAAERYVEIVEAFANDKFILTGGVAGTIYSASEYVGQTNALAMFLQKPDFMHEICKHWREKSVEWIRTLCSAGGDAIYLDDATATSDMISPAIYEEFCVPYISTIVKEAQSLGHKVILIYFGGVMDRLEQIASTGADALAMEASMKGYTNDLEQAAQRIGDRMTLFGNVNPYDHLQQLEESALKKIMQEQAEAGRGARGFIMATGSPITMGTPLTRVQKFIQLAHQI